MQKHPAFRSSVGLSSMPPVALTSHDLLRGTLAPVKPGSQRSGPNSCLFQGCSRLAIDGVMATASPGQAPIVLNSQVTLAGSLDLSKTFQLSSNPFATKSIFLDFDGFQISSTPWENGGALSLGGFYGSLDAAALTEIQYIWQRVAEDFSPFNVNVTTQDPGTEDLRKSGSTDDRWGIRVAFTSNLNLLTGRAITNAGGGGFAYYNSFNWATDDVALVFNRGEYTAAATASHEIGHALNLYHDGNGSNEYYAGHGGTGASSWGTIMGAPWLGDYEVLSQWSKGEYFGANNTQDDLNTITNGNGFTYASDDHGNGFSTATPLTGTSFSSFGVIERNTDVDLFRFDTGTGLVSFNIVNASRAYVSSGSSYSTEYLASRAPNLDISATLYRADQSVVSSFNPATLTDASFEISLDAGSYYLGIDGVGSGTPLASTPSGSTDYGSLGQYMVSGTLQASSIVSTTSTPPPPLPAAAILVSSGSTLVTTEAGGSASFQVGLSRASTSDVIIQISSSDPGEGTVRNSQMVFTSANWQTLQTVTVQGVDDTLVDGTQAYSIQMGSSSSDPAFQGLSGPTVTVQNTDNDVAAQPSTTPVTFLASDSQLTSGGPYIKAPTVVGTLDAIRTSDDQRLAITEGSIATSKGTAINLDAYQWTFANLSEATQLVFEGYRNASSNDNFRIQFSTNGGSQWTTAFTVSNTAESTLTYTLPTPVSGQVLVRAMDTRNSSKDKSFDTLYLNRLVFVGSGEAPEASLSDPIIGTTERFAPGHGHHLGRQRGEADYLPLDSLSFAPSLQGLDVLANPDPMAPAFANGLTDSSATTQPPWLIAAQPLH